MLRRFLFVLLFVSSFVFSQTDDERAKSLESKFRVHLNDVRSLTFEKGKMTTARRTSPISQLVCVGGSAQGSDREPNKITCTNVGTDGPKWQCHSEVEYSDVALGQVSVSCEGYDSPGDVYILKGSCGLEYTLERIQGAPDTKSPGSNLQFYIVWDPANNDGKWTWKVWAIIAGVLVLIGAGVYFSIFQGRRHHFRRKTSGLTQ